MKLGTNVHHVSGYCCKGCKGQRSKVMTTDQTECYNGEGMHFDGVASQCSLFYSCFLYALLSMSYGSCPG